MVDKELTYLDPNVIKERRGRTRTEKAFSSTKQDPSQYERVESAINKLQKRKLPVAEKNSSKKVRSEET